MIFWIASYPKSGNTWVRAILASILHSEDGNFNFKYLEKIKQFPMEEHFRHFTDEIWNIDELAKNWLPSQERLNLDDKIKYFKTHHAVCRYRDYIFTNVDNTLATIYVVRDPRNVINSLAHHYSLNINEAKEMLFSSKRLLGNKKKSIKKGSVYTVLGSWGDHYNSWKKLDKKNTLILRYEDLIKDTRLQIIEIINFLKRYTNVYYTDKKISNILTSTSFESFKTHESKYGFIESVTDSKSNKKLNFFNLGKDNDWKKLLDLNTTKEIESKFSKEMKELGYL